MEILESQNKEHGFYGTAALHGRREVNAKWETAFSWVAAVMPSWSPENIRDFLDGRPGRHLADQLYDCGNIARINPSDWLRPMYEFAVEVGIPTKSGVGGGLMAPVFGKCGIGIFGPSLDKKGNCIAGCEMMKHLSRELGLHMF